mmetsp:Transcript_24567/g.62374  ORF Transcript_24567/g.62374 Transcript_24567/m.62374 type:complete len:182 (-) Transcript_24567:181-726(-)
MLGCRRGKGSLADGFDERVLAVSGGSPNELVGDLEHCSRPVGNAAIHDRAGVGLPLPVLPGRLQLWRPRAMPSGLSARLQLSLVDRTCVPRVLGPWVPRVLGMLLFCSVGSLVVMSPVSPKSFSSASLHGFVAIGTLPSLASSAPGHLKLGPQIETTPLGSNELLVPGRLPGCCNDRSCSS